MTNDLRRKMTADDRVRIAINKTVMSTVETDAFGHKHATGNGATLKESQAYTTEFAEAVVRGWRTHVNDVNVEVADSSNSDYPPDELGPADEWEDAELKRIVAILDSR